MNENQAGNQRKSIKHKDSSSKKETINMLNFQKEQKLKIVKM